MSIGTASGEPMGGGDTFEQDWASAQRGSFEGPASQPASGGGTPEPENPATPGEAPSSLTPPAPASSPVAAQGSPEPAPATPPAQPAPFQLPDHYQQRLREVGAGSLDEALQYARQFQSLKGQLPNLEQRWRQQYVAPVEAELNTLRERERQALERLVTHDPQTGQPRPPEDAALMRQRVEAAQALETQQRTQEQQRQQEQVELAQTRQQLAQAQQQTAEQAQMGLRMTALNAVPLWKEQLVQQYGVPRAELDAYTQRFDWEAKIKGMEGPGFQRFGSMLESLQEYAEMRQGQLQEQTAREQTAKYRDVGSPSGAGGTSSADRWAKSNREDFASAWQRALRGELV